jgi:hypothetical protein
VRNPLNDILGTEANVRLLRVFGTEAAGPLTVSDAAARSGLTIRGTRKAIDRLLKSGFVVRVGGGSKHQYELRHNDKLVTAVVKLFQSEKGRYESLLIAIKNEFGDLTPYAHAAWIQDMPAESGDPMCIGVLHETRQLAIYIEQFQKQLYQIESEFDLTIELNGYTKADLPDVETDKITLIYGFLPFPDIPERKLSTKSLTHEEKDKQMLALSHKLAEAIEKDTSLLQRAKAHVRQMLKSDHGSAIKDIEEWRDILESYSTRRLSLFLKSTSERANRLRQSNPFLAILNSDERKRLLKNLGGNNDA